jgi:predicted nucleotidyltransferase
LIFFKAAGYEDLGRKNNSNGRASHISINNNNANTNTNSISVNTSFEDVRRNIENMSSLPDTEIEEILSKINDLEEIVNSEDRKSKKWEKAKGIIKWIADKGVDVGIALLPLLLQIK